MGKHGLILEGLISSRNKVKVDESAASDIQKGDKIKVMGGDTSLGIPGDIFIVNSISTDPEKVNHVFARLKKDGSTTSILTKGNWFGLRPKRFEELINKGVLRIIKDGEEDIGNVDLNDIKDILKNLDIPKLTGVTLAKLIRTSGRYYIIYLGADEEKREGINNKILRALASRGIKTVDEGETTFNKTRQYMYIERVQI